MTVSHTGNVQPGIDLQEHAGLHDAKRVVLVDAGTGNLYSSGPTVVLSSVPTVATMSLPYSFYQQSSLVSGYVFYGLCTPGSNPTTASFKILRESLNTKEILFGGGVSTFSHKWSGSSLASISYS